MTRLLRAIRSRAAASPTGTGGRIESGVPQSRGKKHATGPSRAPGRQDVKGYPFFRRLLSRDHTGGHEADPSNDHRAKHRDPNAYAHLALARPAGRGMSSSQSRPRA